MTLHLGFAPCCTLKGTKVQAALFLYNRAAPCTLVSVSQLILKETGTCPQIDNFAVGVMARQIGGLDGVDWNTPDKAAARREPWHPDDIGTAGELDPEPGENFDINDLRGIPRNALKSLLRFIIPPPNRRTTKRWDVATVRLAVLARMIDLDDLGALSLEQLGKELGVTRALLSLRSLEIVDELELNKDKLGKKRETREIYRRAALAYHQRMGHRMTVDEPQAASDR